MIAMRFAIVIAALLIVLPVRAACPNGQWTRADWSHWLRVRDWSRRFRGNYSMRYSRRR
jgi:hypothetical protein